MKFKIDPEFKALLPPLSQEERDNLKEKIECEGCFPQSMLVAQIGEEFVLADGHHTYEACQELGIQHPTPRVRKFESRHACMLWMLINQMARRNATDECRAYIIGKIYEAEKANHGGDRASPQNEDLKGKTAENIGKDHKVSKATVERNGQFAAAVDAIGATEGTEAKAKILAGESDKTKAQIIKDAPKLCDRCSRNVRTGQSPVKGCDMCKALHPKKAKKKAEPKADKADVVDDYGVAVPKKCRGAFCDPWIQESIDFLEDISEKVRKQWLIKEAEKRSKHYPFLNHKEFCAGVGFTIQYLDDVIEHLKETRPAGVCPSCSGEGCGDCKRSGLVPANEHKKLSGK